VAIDPVTAGLGAVSMIQGKKANNAARREAGEANRMSRAMEQRVTKLWDTLFQRAEQAEKSGEFDPERRIAAVEKDTARYEGRDMGNLAGALRTAGYKPGDSEIGTRLDAVKTKYRSFLDNLRNDIRDKSWWDQQNAYASANPGMLGGAMGSAQNREAMARSRIQDPSQMLMGLMPFMQGGGQNPQNFMMNLARGMQTKVW